VVAFLFGIVKKPELNLIVLLKERVRNSCRFDLKLIYCSGLFCKCL